MGVKGALSRVFEGEGLVDVGAVESCDSRSGIVSVSVFADVEVEPVDEGMGCWGC